ncbi:MAG: hypothetical protein NC230_07030 [Bacteroides sp.]|nr:hypothetical protein [Bacteroides sp.]MCM1413874.1 hypothetical protein [Bacteroides sp.]
MKAFCIDPYNEAAKALLAQCITTEIGQKGNDWFSLRLFFKVNPNDFSIQSLHVGTGWETPRWAEFSDRGPTFAEKQRFQERFNQCFKNLELNPTPTTQEEIAEFFRFFIQIYPELSRYFFVKH